MISVCLELQISAVKGSLAELKAGLKRVEDEIMVATGIDTGARAASSGQAATHQDFGQLMAHFHESAAGQLQQAEVCVVSCLSSQPSGNIICSDNFCES